MELHINTKVHWKEYRIRTSNFIYTLYGQMSQQNLAGQNVRPRLRFRHWQIWPDKMSDQGCDSNIGKFWSAIVR